MLLACFAHALLFRILPSVFTHSTNNLKLLHFRMSALQLLRIRYFFVNLHLKIKSLIEE